MTRYELGGRHRVLNRGTLHRGEVATMPGGSSPSTGLVVYRPFRTGEAG